MFIKTSAHKFINQEQRKENNLFWDSISSIIDVFSQLMLRVLKAAESYFPWGYLEN